MVEPENIRIALSVFVERLNLRIVLCPCIFACMLWTCLFGQILIESAVSMLVDSNFMPGSDRENDMMSEVTRERITPWVI